MTRQPRRAWTDLPAGVRTAVLDQAGGREFTSTDMPDGGDSGLATLLTFTDERAVFVKGSTDADEIDGLELEADIGPHLPRCAPRYLWSVRADEWFLIAHEGLSGSLADLEAESADLPLIVEALTVIGQQPAPDLSPPLLSAWRLWRKWAPAEAEPLFDGTQLVHCDPAGTNFLTTAHGVYLVDWSHARSGAPWIDPALWAVRLMSDGGHTADSAYRWASRVPAFTEAPPDAVRVLAEAEARRYAHHQANGYSDIAQVTEAAETWAAYLK